MGRFLPGLLIALLVASACRAETLPEIKGRLVALATELGGQSDPDYTRQRALEAVIADLLAAAPQRPLAERLGLLEGVWKQLFGPLDYREDASRAIDPELGIEEIYQVVLPDGVYYNVSPIYPEGDRGHRQTGFLRGRYVLDRARPDRLDVRFTSYRGIEGLPRDGAPIFEMAYRAETGQVEDPIAIVPWLVVQLFFGNGALDEIYTDEDLRLLYGSDGSDGARRALYVMRRVPRLAGNPPVGPAKAANP